MIHLVNLVSRDNWTNRRSSEKKGSTLGKRSRAFRHSCPAPPQVARIRSDKRVSWAKCSMHGACEKRHTHIEIASLSFAHWIAKNFRKLSDFTYHSKKVKCSSEGGTAVFRLSTHISISSGLGFALGKFSKFPVFLALKYTSITGHTDVTELKKKKALY